MESLSSQIAHWISSSTGIVILGILLKEHRVWIRLKDRVNQLWKDRCKEKGDDYIPLENGR